jgi:hypothetical protein
MKPKNKHLQGKLYCNVQLRNLVPLIGEEDGKRLFDVVVQPHNKTEVVFTRPVQANKQEYHVFLSWPLIDGLGLKGGRDLEHVMGSNPEKKSCSSRTKDLLECEGPVIPVLMELEKEYFGKKKSVDAQYLVSFRPKKRGKKEKKVEGAEGRSTYKTTSQILAEAHKDLKDAKRKLADKNDAMYDELEKPLAKERTKYQENLDRLDSEGDDVTDEMEALSTKMRNLSPTHRQFVDQAGLRLVHNVLKKFPNDPYRALKYIAAIGERNWMTELTDDQETPPENIKPEYVLGAAFEAIPACYFRMLQELKRKVYIDISSKTSSDQTMFPSGLVKKVWISAASSDSSFQMTDEDEENLRNAINDMCNKVGVDEESCDAFLDELINEKVKRDTGFDVIVWLQDQEVSENDIRGNHFILVQSKGIGSQRKNPKVGVEIYNSRLGELSKKRPERLKSYLFFQMYWASNVTWVHELNKKKQILRNLKERRESNF